MDTDVVVPSKLIEKAQYGAYTIRPRLYRALPEYLVAYENPHANHGGAAEGVSRRLADGGHDAGLEGSGPERGAGGGVAGRDAHAGLARLKLFTGKLLDNYEVTRNKPEMDGTSAMSPYLHYGHVGPQTIALAVRRRRRRIRG